MAISSAIYLTLLHWSRCSFGKVTRCDCNPRKMSFLLPSFDSKRSHKRPKLLNTSIQEFNWNELSIQNWRCQIVRGVGISAHAKFDAVKSSSRVPVGLGNGVRPLCTGLEFCKNSKLTLPNSSQVSTQCTCQVWRCQVIMKDACRCLPFYAQDWSLATLQN